MVDLLGGGTDQRSFWSTLSWSSDIDRDSSSNRSFAKIRAWLSNCAAVHPRCLSAPTPLPTRVIDVRDPDGGTPYRVCETQGEFGHYMAPSHCWGPPELIFKTTVQTLESNKTELPWGRLSKTFRDAIEVRVRYIWIDSLCILQDDEVDWNKEAANMGNIYKNAYPTLAATASSSGMGGLHVERDDDFVGIPMPKWQNLGLATLKARKRCPHFSLEVLESGDPPVHRGLAYQERLLAGRIIHFTSEEMIWECKTQQTCECGSLSGPQESRSEFESLLEGGRKSWWSWKMLLTRYSTLQLSKEEDRLPALSGVTSQLFEPSDYLAGLSRRWIIKDLCWERDPT